MYRAHYGYASSPLVRASDGRHTSALYSFCNLLLSLLSSYSPSHVVAALDLPSSSSYRRSLYPQYKAHRTDTPSDLRWQLMQVQAVCQQLGVAGIGVHGHEADDVIASLISREAEAVTAIVSQDKDFVQLLTERCSLLRFSSTATSSPAAAAFSSSFSLLPFTPSSCVARYGIPPSLFADYLALVGDASDNIPGIASVGSKTATLLLQHFRSLDLVLAAAAEEEKQEESNTQSVTAAASWWQRRRGGDKVRRALVEGREQALLWRRLVRMRDDLPVPPLHELSVEGWWQEERAERMAAALLDMEFPSLAEKARKIAQEERLRRLRRERELEQSSSRSWGVLQELEQRVLSVVETGDGRTAVQEAVMEVEQVQLLQGDKGRAQRKERRQRRVVTQLAAGAPL